MRLYVLSLTIVDDDSEALVSGSICKEMSASLPVDQQYNMQRDAHYFIEEAFRCLEAKDALSSGGQPRQTGKSPIAVSRQDQKPDPDYLRHGDEGPIRSAEATH